MNEIASQTIEYTLKISHDTTQLSLKKLLHFHDNGYELLLFISGNANYFFGDAIYHVKPGDLLLIPPNVIHGYSLNSDVTYERIPLHIQSHMLTSLLTEDISLLEMFHDPEHRIIHLTKAEMEKYIHYSDEIIQFITDKPYGYKILSQAHLLLLLLTANIAYHNATETAKDISPNIVQNAIEYINLHLTEDLTVQSIADALCISNSRLSHLFKESTNTSVWNYVMTKRLILSRSLLLRGKTVADACYECGFRNYAHFNKLFSKTFHISPGKFMKNLSGDEENFFGKPTVI